MDEEKAYWTHEISKLLSISDSTLRKWCLELEKQGYIFAKGKNNSRAFVVRDRNILIELKHLVQSEGLTIEKASNQLINDEKISRSNGSNDTHSNVPQVVRESFEDDFKKINNRFDQQEEFNQKLLERMDQRDQNLMAVLREMQETKKQISAAKEKRWWKFWK